MNEKIAFLKKQVEEERLKLDLLILGAGKKVSEMASVGDFDMEKISQMNDIIIMHKQILKKYEKDLEIETLLFEIERKQENE